MRVKRVPAMQAGKLSTRVSIWQLKGTTSLDAGGHLLTAGNAWVAGRRWAQVDLQGATEAYDGDAMRGATDARIIMRADRLTTKLNARHVITIKDRSYQVTSVATDPRGQHVIITARSVDGEWL